MYKLMGKLTRRSNDLVNTEYKKLAIINREASENRKSGEVSYEEILSALYDFDQVPVISLIFTCPDSWNSNIAALHCFIGTLHF